MVSVLLKGDRRMKKLSFFVFVLAVSTLVSIASVSLYAGCDPAICDAASNPCSQCIIARDPNTFEEGCFRLKVGDFGVDPGKCLVTNEFCNACECHKYYSYQLRQYKCKCK